eukprot:1067161-Amphidinium_carterae.1
MRKPHSWTTPNPRVGTVDLSGTHRKEEKGKLGILDAAMLAQCFLLQARSTAQATKATQTTLHISKQIKQP